MEKAVPATPKTHKRRAWLVMLVMLAVGAATLGGVYWWRWAHWPPGLRVVARYQGSVSGFTDGFALTENVRETNTARTIFRDWTGREVWRMEDAYLYSGVPAGRFFSPDGHWLVRTPYYDDPEMGTAPKGRAPATLWHDGQKVRTEAVAPLHNQGLRVTNDGMAWFISYKTSTLTVAALDANGVRTGRTALPAPVLPLSKRGKPGRCSISDAYATPDGAMLEVGATISDDFLSFRVYPKYRTYRIHVLHDRLTLEKTAEDTSTMHEEFIGHHIADQRVTTPSGEWAIPGGAQSSGQTPDGRYAFALRGGPPPQRPSALDIIRAKWNALRRVPAPPTKAAATYVVSVYEQPGTLRFSTVLPLDTSNGYEYSLGIDVSPDGHAALVQAGTGHATHLVRW